LAKRDKLFPAKSEMKSKPTAKAPRHGFRFAAAWLSFTQISAFRISGFFLMLTPPDFRRTLEKIYSEFGKRQKLVITIADETRRPKDTKEKDAQ
jgi:hypothetical protein